MRALYLGSRVNKIGMGCGSVRNHGVHPKVPNSINEGEPGHRPAPFASPRVPTE
jgi:hypothetical protein